MASQTRQAHGGHSHRGYRPRRHITIPVECHSNFHVWAITCLPRAKNVKMKTILTTILMLAIHGCQECPAQSADSVRWEALAMQESGCDDNAVGSAGEVSRYQILPSVWRTVTVLPISAAKNPCTALNVASAIMRERMRMNREDEKDFGITDLKWVLLWKCPTRVDHPSPAKLEQAECVVNLIGKLNRQDAKNAKTPDGVVIIDSKLSLELLRHKLAFLTKANAAKSICDAAFNAVIELEYKILTAETQRREVYAIGGTS
jgi:hypothetical protein